MESADAIRDALKVQIREAFAGDDALPTSICPCDCEECTGIAKAYRGMSRDDLTDDDYLHFFARGPTSLLSHQALFYFLPNIMVRSLDDGWEELISSILWNLCSLKGRHEVRFTSPQHAAVWAFLSYIVRFRRTHVDETEIRSACRRWTLPAELQ